MSRNRLSDRIAFADVRSALRSLRRSPGFTLLAALTLGLGAGVAAALFALLQSVVLAPLPVADESALVVAWGDHRTRDFEHFPFTRAVRERVAEGARGVEGAAGVEASGARERLVESAGAGDRLTPMRWSRVLGDFFGVLGVVPAAGRTLAASDDLTGGPGVAVVSHELWQRRWGGRDDAVGATLTVGGAGDGRTFTVVGVAPPGFDYPRGTEVWTPILPWFPGADPPRLELDLVARLAPEGTPERFAAELARLNGSDPELSEVYSEVEPVVRPLREVVLGDLRPVVLLLFAGGVLLLLVAGVDVANLVLLRAGERAAGQALRRALGAGRAHLFVAPVVEALMITALAGVVAALVVRGGLHLFLPLAPEGLPRLDRVAPDAGTWGFLAGVLAFACLVLAAIPRLRRPSAASLGAMLRSGARGSPSSGRRRGPRRWIVAGQAALAVWAAVTAVLLVQSLSNLVSLDPGFRQEGLSVVQLDHPHPYFRVPAGWPERAASAMASLERTPGVVAATPVMAPPLTGSGAFDVAPTLEGRPAAEGPEGQVPYLNFELTLPGYFETLGLSVRRGRRTAAEDRAGAPPAVVVNESAARALWPGEEALGQSLRLPFPGYEETVWTVVGVVADARYRAFPEVRPSLYAPLHQIPIIAPRWVAVRTAREGAPGDLLGPVAAAFADADPSVRVVGGAPVGERMAAPLARPRLALAVLGTLAAIVLLLAAVGTYGAVAASVRGRTREMGVRMACGATAGDVGGLILREALALAAAGVAAGATAALASGRFVESLLYGVGARDPRALAVAAAVVLATTLAACLAPAWRAARTDPREAIRAED